MNVNIIGVRRWRPHLHHPRHAQQARGQSRYLDRSQEQQPLPGRLRRRPLRELTIAPPPGSSRRTCPPASSTTSPSDEDAPFYHVYGGTQDNNSVGCAARTKNTVADQRRLLRDQRRRRLLLARRPQGPQHHLRRHARTPASCASTSAPASASPSSRSPPRAIPPLRWNWDAPFIDQPALQYAALLSASQKLYRSDDRGDSWVAGQPRPDPPARPQQAAPDGQDLAHRRHPEERLHRALRQHLVAWPNRPKRKA